MVPVKVVLGQIPERHVSCRLTYISYFYSCISGEEKYWLECTLTSSPYMSIYAANITGVDKGW